MNEESQNFQRAFGMANYNQSEAIRLYNIEIQTNPNNYAAFNNRGNCKMQLAQLKKDNELLEDAKADLRTAIQLCKKIDKSPYEGAEHNLELANSIQFK